MSDSNVMDALSHVTDELKNFEEIVLGIKPRPGSIPDIEGLEVHGAVLPLNGIVGGDHLIYMDYKKRYDLDARIREAEGAGRSDVVTNLERCKKMAGIAVIDVSGHQSTDALVAAMVHQAFLMGALYELDQFGNITSKLFENLNTRLFHSSQLNKFVTAIYGEISEGATFRFLSAAHPLPVVFSAKHNKLMEINPDCCTSFPPLGTLPSRQHIDRDKTSSVLGFKDRYELNEWTLMGKGDIMLLHTDGLTEHARGRESYFPERLETTIRASKDLSATQIVQAIEYDMRDFAAPSDDITLVVIKRTSE